MDQKCPTKNDFMIEVCFKYKNYILDFEDLARHKTSSSFLHRLLFGMLIVIDFFGQIKIF